MNRRRLLAGVAGGVAAGLAGCAGVLGSASGSDVPESDRPLVNETFAAGPTDPTCVSSGKAHYPPMDRQTEWVGGVPEARDAATVGSFVRERSRLVSGPVTLREERYARIAWRAREENITERYRSERHFVGRIESDAADLRVLVVLYGSQTKVVRYRTARNC